MKYATQAIATLWVVSHCNSAVGNESVDTTGHTTKFAGIKLFNKLSRVKSTDTGILNLEHYRKVSVPVDTCPETCTNDALCSCLSDYNYNPDGEDSCQDVIISGCKADELSSCAVYENLDDVGFVKYLSYFYCPFLQCLEESGLTLYGYQENMTASLDCYCEAKKNQFQKSEANDELVPIYAYFEAKLITCCATETSIRDIGNCLTSHVTGNDEGEWIETITDVSAKSSIVSNVKKNLEDQVNIDTTTDEVALSTVDSAIKEELSDSSAAAGSNYNGTGKMSAVAVISIISGVFAFLGFN